MDNYPKLLSGESSGHFFQMIIDMGRRGDPEKALKRYQLRIVEALHPDDEWLGGLDVDAVEEAIREFQRRYPIPEKQADLYCFAIREASRLAELYGPDFGEEFYAYFEGLFSQLLQLLAKCELLTVYRHRLEKLVKKSTDAYDYRDNLEELLGGK